MTTGGDLDPRLGEMFDSEPVSVIRSSQLIIEEAYDDGDIDLEEYLKGKKYIKVAEK